ncbi:uncharacterized protein LOC131595187 [Vicia villosa]|uniref:uncharacterized protein LOC131595187 n=1 Tax=Vicia villosa TaxID=3911 RepID=UPI00273CCB90|nr:uncharacterized protein LOC131595187 [Vicia villosa]
MSQSPSSKKSSPISETASGSRAPNAVSDQDVVLDVVPLNSVPPSDSARSHPRKMHARKSTGGSVPETFSVQGREGSSYVHNAIANIVTRILNEGHKVEGISVPLAQMPASDDDQGEHDDVSKDQDNDETPVANDVRTSVDNDETHVAKDVKTSVDNDKTPVAKDVETSEAVNAEEVPEPEKDEEVPAIPAKKDENPNVVKARKGKQVCEQQSLKPQVTPLKTVTKEKMKKVPTGPSESGNKWKFVYQRRLALERELANDALEIQEVMQLIKTAGRNAEAQPELEVTDNEVCKVITGGTVKKWPIKSKLSASSLNVRYALLHKIGAANWVPTNHTSTIAVGLGRFIYVVGTKTKFDYGTYIFDQTMRHAGTSATKLPIAFPSLICGIILKQHPGILKSKDTVCKRETALSFHYKLLQRSDDKTSAGTSQPSKSVTKALLIAELKETCQELDNRKLKLENLIHSLEQSTDDDLVGDKGGDNMDEDQEAEAEAKDAEAESAGSESSDAVEWTSSSSDDNPGGSSDTDSDGADD